MESLRFLYMSGNMLGELLLEPLREAPALEILDIEHNLITKLDISPLVCGASASTMQKLTVDPDVHLCMDCPGVNQLPHWIANAWFDQPINTWTTDVSECPTPSPTAAPSASPTPQPTSEPTTIPTPQPTSEPSASPTVAPTNDPNSAFPTPQPTSEPTTEPTSEPTTEPTSSEPTSEPTTEPTSEPTGIPTTEPTSE